MAVPAGSETEDSQSWAPLGSVGRQVHGGGVEWIHMHARAYIESPHKHNNSDKNLWRQHDPTMKATNYPSAAAAAAPPPSESSCPSASISSSSPSPTCTCAARPDDRLAAAAAPVKSPLALGCGLPLSSSSPLLDGSRQ